MKNNVLAGITGAIVMALILTGVFVWIKPFEYKPVRIINPEVVVSDSMKVDNLTINQIAVLKDLENKGILLTPHEYTSHIISYYNTLVGLLIGLFILFSFVSFWNIKNTAKKDVADAVEAVEKKLSDSLIKSVPFMEGIKDGIIGRIQDNLITKADKQIIDKNLDDIMRKQIVLEENVNLLFDEVDAKSEIKA